MPDATVFAVVLTSTEWRSMLAFGDLRLPKRRVQEVGVPPGAKQRDRLFSWAPTTVLGDSNDTVVVELVDPWLERAERHPAHSSEIVVIALEHVFAHYSVSPESNAYLSADAEKEGVVLSTGRYETAWAEWVGLQQAAVDLAAARALVDTFGIQVDLTRKRQDGYAWHDIIRLARNSKTSVKTKPKHVEDLLRSVRPISNAIAGVHATSAFTLAANIEWVEARLGKDPFANKAVRETLYAALEVGRTIEWSVDSGACPPVAEALKFLAETFPRAFSPEVSPEVVALTTRLVMSSKDQSLGPIDVASAIGHLRAAGSHESAATVCVAVSGALGPLVSHRLARALATVNPTVLDWE